MRTHIIDGEDASLNVEQSDPSGSDGECLAGARRQGCEGRDYVTLGHGVEFIPQSVHSPAASNAGTNPPPAEVDYPAERPGAERGRAAAGCTGIGICLADAGGSAVRST